jgi:hypothetical protein
LTLFTLALLLVLVPVLGTVTAGAGALDKKVPTKVNAPAGANMPAAVPTSDLGTGTSAAATGTTQLVPQEDTVTTQNTNTAGQGGIEVTKLNDVNRNGNIGSGDVVLTSPSVTFKLYNGSVLVDTVDPGRPGHLLADAAGRLRVEGGHTRGLVGEHPHQPEHHSQHA